MSTTALPTVLPDHAEALFLLLLTLTPNDTAGLRELQAKVEQYLAQMRAL